MKIILILCVLSLSCITNASSIDEASWYLSLDVNRIKDNEVFKALSIDNVRENLPKEISHIVLYGDSKGSEDATAVLTGDFSRFSLADYILDLASSKNAPVKITETRSNYHNYIISTLKASSSENSEHRNKQAYFSKINDQLYIVGFKLDEIKKWIDNSYSTLDINKGSLFSVVVNVESALAHMGINLEDNSHHMMQSKIFQNVLQASASVTEVNEDMEIELALNTADDKTATQIEQILTGLIAMNNLSGNNERNELHTLLMQNLQVQRVGANIFVSTFAAIAAIKDMQFHKHLN